jgi:hypothetical protein
VQSCTETEKRSDESKLAKRESGCEIRVSARCPRGRTAGKLIPVSRYLLQHRHEPQECGVVFASFKGHPSPLRHRATLASCRYGGHEIVWTVEAETEEDALALLPPYVAKRTTVSRVSEIRIP